MVGCSRQQQHLCQTSHQRNAKYTLLILQATCDALHKWSKGYLHCKSGPKKLKSHEVTTFLLQIHFLAMGKLSVYASKCK